MVTSQDHQARRRQFCRGDGRSKKAREIEQEIGRQHQRIDRTGVWRFPDGNGRQGKLERYCCNFICGAPKIEKFKGQR